MRIIKQYLDEMGEEVDLEDTIQQSLVLKYGMLKWMGVGMLGFSLAKAAKYGGINMSEDEWMIVRANVVIQGLDFIWMLLILVPCHPRKEWPQFFTLSITELAGQRGRAGNAGPIAPNAPILTSQIT